MEQIILAVSYFFIGFYIAIIAYQLFTFSGRRRGGRNVYYVFMLLSIILMVLVTFVFPIVFKGAQGLGERFLLFFRFFVSAFTFYSITRFTMVLFPFPRYVGFLKNTVFFSILIPHFLITIVAFLWGDEHFIITYLFVPGVLFFNIFYCWGLFRILSILNRRKKLVSWHKSSFHGFFVFIVMIGVHGFMFLSGTDTLLMLIIDNIGFTAQAVFFTRALTKQFNKNHEDLETLKDNLEVTVEERTNQLVEANNKISQQNKERTTFFINLAHELKTPVTLIDNFIDRYDSPKGSPEDFQIIKRNFYKLKRDVVNFLDLEKLTRGQVYYNHNLVIDVGHCIDEKIPLFTGGAVKKDITLIYEVSGDTLFAAIDPFAFDRIINNLLENALRYTPDGGKIVVFAGARDGKIVVSVSDTGIGIAEDRIETIFDPYHQIRNEKLNLQGMGMGLSIVKRIIDQVGGEITVSSVPGEGSVFTVLLPAASESAFVHSAGDSAYRGGSVISKPVVLTDKPVISACNFDETKHTLLIVEDTPDMLAWLVDSFRGEYNVFFAENGRKALEVLDTMPVRPDCILSDLMMDELDGFGLYDAVVNEKGLGEVPFIFVTARLSEPDKLKALSLGAVDFIFKPFAVDELKLKVKSVVSLIDVNIEQKKRLFMDRISGMVGKKSKSPKVVVKGHSFDEQSQIFAFSKREKEIARLIFDGLQNKEIAAKMGIAIRTVDTHVYKILKKAECSNRTELVRVLTEGGSA